MDHIHQDTAAGGQRMTPVGLVFSRARIINNAQEMQGGDAQVADYAVGEQPFDLAIFGQEVIIVHQRHLQAGRISRARQLGGDRRHIADRFLAEHVHPGREGIQRDLRSVLLGHGDDHGVNLVDGEQRAVILVAVDHRASRTKPARWRGVPA